MEERGLDLHETGSKLLAEKGSETNNNLGITVTERRDRDTPRLTTKSIVILMAAILLLATLVTMAVVLATYKNDGTSGVVTQAIELPSYVQTPVGRVLGTVVTQNGKSFLAYKSIPFAKPPVGELRFKRPQEPEKPARTQDVINNEDYKKSCWSATKKTTSRYYGEDCLYLNVYAPAEKTSSSESLPALVWIHGGGFVAGSTFPEPGKMVSDGQVIVVSINYRLGVFGFLTTLDDELPSNNGLWDQYMAIKWVKNNIKYFGGNPSSITVFGESAGAISTALHVISPVSAPLFDKAILQSGGMTSAISRDPGGAANRFAGFVNCSSASSSSALASCLRNVSVSDILKYTNPRWYVSSLAQRQIEFVWVPVVDGSFIPSEPLVLLNNVTYLDKVVGAFDKQYLMGVVNDEGALLSTNFFFPIPVSVLANDTFFNDLRDVLLLNRFGPDVSIKSTVVEAVNSFYTGEPYLTKSPSFVSVLDLGGDLALTLPTMEAALAFSQPGAQKRAKTFFYHFDYCPAKSEGQPPCLGHGEDVAFEFPSKNFTNPEEAKLSDIFISVLTEFARSSNPGVAVSCGWPEFNPESRQYLRIAPTPDVRSHLINYRLTLWFDTVPRLMKDSV